MCVRDTSISVLVRIEDESTESLLSAVDISIIKRESDSNLIVRNEADVNHLRG